MATPTIAALNARYPDAAIDVATGPWTAPAFATNRRVARVVDTGRLLGGRRPQPLTLRRAAAALHEGRYDAAVVLERSIWLAFLPLLAGIRIRAGLDSGGRGLPHTMRVRIPTRARHEAELYLECARRLDAPPLEPARLEFWPETDGHDEDEPMAVLHPGGGSNPGMDLLSKRWPADRFAEIARRLGGTGLRVAVARGPTDASAARALLAAAPGCIDLGPDLPLARLAAILRRARLYVGNDSGPTHLATAVGTPTVAIFGPSDERRFGPFGHYDDRTAIGEAVASPLLGADDPATAWPTRPVEAVTVDQAWSAVERALGKAKVKA